MIASGKVLPTSATTQSKYGEWFDDAESSVSMQESGLLLILCKIL